MTDRYDEAPEYREHELRDKVSALGDTPEDALEEVASRNDSLQERLPDEELSVSGRESASGDADAVGPDDDSDVPHGEGAPGQG